MIITWVTCVKILMCFYVLLKYKLVRRFKTTKTTDISSSCCTYTQRERCAGYSCLNTLYWLICLLLFSKVHLVYLWKRKYPFFYFVYETFVMKLSRLVWKCSCSHLQGVESYSIISWLPSRSISSLT